MNIQTQIFFSGVLGGCFAFLAHVGDIFTCWSPNAGGDGTTDSLITYPSDMLTIEAAAELMRSKPYWHFVVGHVLAMVFIPATSVSAFHLVHMLRTESVAARVAVASLVGVAFVSGTIMHCSFTFVGVVAAGLARFEGGEGADQSYRHALLSDLKPFFEWACTVTVQGLMVAAFVFLVSVVLLGQTHYPRWFVLCTPPAFQLYTALLSCMVSSPAVKLYFIVTTYNLSNALWLLCSTRWYYAKERNAISFDGATKEKRK